MPHFLGDGRVSTVLTLVGFFVHGPVDQGLTTGRFDEHFHTVQPTVHEDPMRLVVGLVPDAIDLNWVVRYYRQLRFQEGNLFGFQIGRPAPMPIVLDEERDSHVFLSPNISSTE